ncbi:hypothetical protein [Muribaculum gordoncarteri]|uniref:hypothetical protein n=1 Tax=Muribaculum gordoncarteri TaxID=2530390 RepID=UPI003F66F0E3
MADATEKGAGNAFRRKGDGKNDKDNPYYYFGAHNPTEDICAYGNGPTLYRSPQSMAVDEEACG